MEGIVKWEVEGFKGETKPMSIDDCRKLLEYHKQWSSITSWLMVGNERMLIRVCMWCKRRIGLKKGGPRSINVLSSVTDGVCEHCGDFMIVADQISLFLAAKKITS